MKKILVFEDNAGIAELVEIILKERGFSVKTVENGKGVLRVVKKIKPDLILLDILMPGMKGQEVIKVLKQEQTTKNIPVIIFSALNEIQDIAKSSRADDFLPKPFDTTDLVEIVKKHTSS